MINEDPTNARDSRLTFKTSKLGLVVAGGLATIGIGLVALSIPFISPALRRYCLPFVPATENQLENLSRSFRKHSKLGDSFVDVGSGDGRVCRAAYEVGIFSRIHGVELNSLLVLYSRILAIKLGHRDKLKYHHRNLWRFPLDDYDAICIFGVDVMMDSLSRYLLLVNKKPQTVYACRFPFKQWAHIDQFGEGIDAVWVYRLTRESLKNNSLKN